MHSVLHDDEIEDLYSYSLFPTTVSSWKKKGWTKYLDCAAELSGSMCKGDIFLLHSEEYLEKTDWNSRVLGTDVTGKGITGSHFTKL